MCKWLSSRLTGGGEVSEGLARCPHEATLLLLFMNMQNCCLPVWALLSPFRWENCGVAPMVKRAPHGKSAITPHLGADLLTTHLGNI